MIFTTLIKVLELLKFGTGEIGHDIFGLILPFYLKILQLYSGKKESIAMIR